MDHDLLQCGPAHEARACELTPGQVAQRAGVTVSALHFFERQGLLSSTRTTGNQRRYRRGVLRRVALIRVAQRAGIPLKEVAAALSSLPADRAPNRQDWQRLSQQWQRQLDERIRALEQLRNSFSDCIGCGCLSMDRCPLANPDDALAERGPGAHLLGARQRRIGVEKQPGRVRAATTTS